MRKDASELKKYEGEWLLTNSLLESVVYLFKDSSYSYEKEARVLYSYANYSKRIKNTNQSPPKLFVYTDYCVAIDELILGPKFEDVYLWSPFIKSQLEKMNKITGQMEMTKLTLSVINYR